MTTSGQQSQAPNGSKWTLDPQDKYKERKAALALDDPVRARLDGLEFALERSPWPPERCDPIQPEKGQANRFWGFRSSLAHGLPVVEIIFKIWNRTVKLLDYAVRDA